MVSGILVAESRRGATRATSGRLRTLVVSLTVLADAQLLRETAHSSPRRTPAAKSRIDSPIRFKEAKRRLVEDLERRYVTELLEAHDGNVTAAARAADFDRMTLYKMLRRAGLRDPSVT